jgi:hypothetical protein
MVLEPGSVVGSRNSRVGNVGDVGVRQTEHARLYLLRFGEFYVDDVWTPLPGLGYCDEHAAVVKELFRVVASDRLVAPTTATALPAVARPCYEARRA